MGTKKRKGRLLVGLIAMLSFNWFYLDWWKYLFEKHDPDVSWWTAFWCRALNHPSGVVWYNPCGDEPNMTCKNCGDDLG